jgi:DNA-binding MarR family transcriptional regulator
MSIYQKNNGKCLIFILICSILHIVLKEVLEMSEIIGPKIKMLNVLIEKDLNNFIRDFNENLTGQQFAILVELYNSTRPYLTQKEIETEFRLSHPTTRGIIKRLQKLDFVTSEQMASDRRQVLISLSDNGQKFMDNNFDKMFNNIKLEETRMTKGISDEEQRLFVEIIEKMISNL